MQGPWEARETRRSPSNPVSSRPTHQTCRGATGPGDDSDAAYLQADSARPVPLDEPSEVLGFPTLEKEEEEEAG